jgi:hypothetical protein
MQQPKASDVNVILGNEAKDLSALLPGGSQGTARYLRRERMKHGGMRVEHFMGKEAQRERLRRKLEERRRKKPKKNKKKRK